MSINIAGVMFKSSVEDEKEFLQDRFWMKNIDGFSKSTWDTIQTLTLRKKENQNNLVAVYQKNGCTCIYYDLLDFYSERAIENYCKDILKEHDGVNFVCSEIAMEFIFVFYTNGKRERMTVTYPPNGPRRINGKNNLKMPRGGDEIESLLILQNEYFGDFEPNDEVNLYWISDKQRERNQKDGEMRRRERLLKEGRIISKESLPKGKSKSNGFDSLVIFWLVAIAILALFVWIFGLLFK